MAEQVSDFWRRVEHYRQIGIDPLKWVAGCAVKVDLTTVVYPALHALRPELKEFGITVNPRQDADIFLKTSHGIELERRVYDTKEPNVDPNDLRRLNPKRAISLIQVHQRTGGSVESFAEVLRRLYRRIGEAGIELTIGKGHSIITAYPDAEFALFDFIQYDGGKSEGYVVANNDTIQLIDPTDEPGSQPQTYVALSNALADLVTLGCYENLQIFPVYDAPNEEITQQIEHHLDSFAKENGIDLHTRSTVGKRKLLIGATVIGDLGKEPPMFYNRLESGMKILVTRSFGDLAPINVYLASEADPDFLAALREGGLSLEGAKKAKEEIVQLMKLPNTKIGETINKHLPDFSKSFSPSEHIAVTSDLSGPGIYVFKEIAQLGSVDIRLEEVPLKYPEYAFFASRYYLMDNATAGTNGAVAIVASPDIIDDVASELNHYGYEPRIIGDVMGRGEGEVRVKKSVRDLIAAKTLQGEFIYE